MESYAECENMIWHKFVIQSIFLLAKNVMQLFSFPPNTTSANSFQIATEYF